MRSKFIITAALTAAAFVTGTQAHAALLAEETFSSYGVNANLSGGNGGTGWSGAWSVGAPGQGFLNQVRNNQFSFSYPGYTAATTPALSGGNYLNLAAGFGGPAFNFAQRAVDTAPAGTFATAGVVGTNSAGQTAVGADGTTVWGSLLYQGNGQFWLRNPGVGDNQFPLPALSTANDPPTDANINLVVFKIDYAAGNDTLSLFIDPDLSTFDGTGTPTSTRTADLAFNTFIWVENVANSENRLDDVRFGTSVFDVVPAAVVPEPAMLGLAALAVPVLARRRSAR